MNKKGQALVAFIILLPVLLLFLVFLVDMGYVINRKIVVKNIIEVKENLISNEEKLAVNKIEYSEIYNKNNCIYVKTSVESIFGQIIGKTKYQVLVKKCSKI